MTLSDTDRLAALRTQWHAARAAGDAERLMAIEGEAAQIKALHCITAVFPDARLLPTGIEDPR